MLQKIITWPNQKLKVKSEPIINFNSEELVSLEKDLIDTCNVSMGVGLAATQIGLKKAAIVIKPEDFGYPNPSPSEYNSDYFFLVNPNIISSSEEKFKWKEACLSVPGLVSSVDRFSKCVVEYYDSHGEAHTIEAEGEFAGGLQHEIDHLLGVVFVDKISNLKRSMYRKKIMKARKKQQRLNKKLNKHI